MWIQGKDGRVGEHKQFTCCDESTFSVVKLSDGTFEEWNIRDCREVTLKAAEEKFTSGDKQSTQSEKVPCSPSCQGHVSHPCEKCGQQW